MRKATVRKKPSHSSSLAEVLQHLGEYVKFRILAVLVMRIVSKVLSSDLE